MLQSRKQDNKTCRCLSDRQSIGILCMFKLLITYLPGFFWFGMILEANKKKTMETWDVALMYIMLAFSVAMVISAFTGFIGVLSKRFDVCRIFMISDIVHCVYFGATTIGLIILSTFVLIKGEDKMNNYRWTKLINMYNGKYGKYILPISVSATILFIFMTFLSIMCHGKVRRWTKYTKSLIPSKQESANIVISADPLDLKSDEAKKCKEDSLELGDEKIIELSESSEDVQRDWWSSTRILLPPENQEKRHDEMKKLAKDMKENPAMTGKTDPRSSRWSVLARQSNGC